jgi:hypothetical protein
LTRTSAHRFALWSSLSSRRSRLGCSRMIVKRYVPVRCRRLRGSGCRSIIVEFLQWLVL